MKLVISAAASKSTYMGVLSMFFGWLVSSNAAIVVGMLVGIAGFFINWYYKRADFKLRAAAEAREARLDALRELRLQRGMRTDTDLGDLGDA